MKVVSPIVFVVILTVCAASASARHPLLPSSIRNLSSNIPENRQSFSSGIEDNGIRLELNYRGEAFHSFGIESPGRTPYRGLLDIYLGLDTWKSGLWAGGELFIKVQDGRGKGLSINPAGIALPISNIDARDFTQISEFGLKQSFLDGKLKLSITKQDVNSVFCVNESGDDFIFPSFTLIPTIPMPTFPAPALGVTLSSSFMKNFSAGAGFYNGGSQIGKIGFDTFFEGEKGYFSVFEPAWKPGFGPGRKLHGNYRLGLWHRSGDFPQTGFHSQPESFDHNYGFYVMINQTLYRWDHNLSAGHKLGVFIQFGWAPSDRNEVSRYWGGGLSCRGLLPGRNRDVAAAGLGNMQLNGTGPGAVKTEVTYMELFYVARVTSWLSLQPDIQYFTDVGPPRQGSGLAIGLRSLVDF